MEQLSGLDGAFLAMETRSVFGHVGSVCIVDAVTADGGEPGMTLQHLTEVIESRLPLVPLLRRRLVMVPFGLDHPYWIEDPDFDIEFHVRELALPFPGNDRQLSEQVARLHARPLDRSRPLWELYLITGLQGGRAAIYSKIHHAAIDGVSGGDILTAVLDMSPRGRELPAVESFAGEQPPDSARLLGRSAVNLARQPLQAFRLVSGLARSIPAIANAFGAPIAQLMGGKDNDDVLSQTGLRAPSTPFNAPVSPHRRWAFADLPLGEVKKLRRGSDGDGLTVNDVVMALCAGALRRWLLLHDALPTAPLIAAVPVSVRTMDHTGESGNRVSMMLAALPTNLSGPGDRLAAMHDAMRAAKDQHGAIPAGLLADVSQFAMPVLANQAWRLSAKLRLFERASPFNLFISNVPGPNVPLYFAGAELLAYYPVSAVADGQGLNITVMSYRDNLYFGLVACRQLVPDLDIMAGFLRDELDALTAALQT
ncbi:MAG: wax ester/triacylglycerol synthase family O-acyltransferase [Phycicoccus sp.]|nr:wax ester/triacylglycerol synthase family O-acyltransferase [Phycicoccus sp.]NMM34446.1 wax ester/triacylglycerol synthase family O-acyltransferase [Phycicoccus sp.]